MNYKQMLDKFTELEKRMSDLEVAYATLQARVTSLESRHLTFGPGFTPGTLPQKWNLGCHVCGIGSKGEVLGYACPRSDCPSSAQCIGDMQ